MGTQPLKKALKRITPKKALKKDTGRNQEPLLGRAALLKRVLGAICLCLKYIEILHL